MKHAVIVANLGAPSNLSEVRPFLKQLFADPDIFNFPFGKLGQAFFSSMIATLRAPKSKKYYAAIGGGSPLHENTVAQALKLEKMLNEKGDFTVFTAQRYWHPFFEEIAAEVRQGNFDDIILVPMYPHYSTTTTLSIVNEWKRVSGDLPEPIVIERFYAEPGYVKACANQIRATLSKFHKPPHILFSAHSIPVSRVKAGDPYEKEINANMELIMDELRRVYNYSLCYQSKVGPVEWLGPEIQDALDGLVKNKGVTNVLVFPIAFVSEHVETLYELDIQTREYAKKIGIKQFERADTVQDLNEFIAVLKKLILERVAL
ncbi:MAG: ferrochelatase [Candidatus Marinimicrobia bacterium CG_4_9_14_3_um_filter_48_9]|nr:MAG: ferrochelatase [Candidatus Marinimicrobia bacterium CG_4_9_14_3_um_filter_48_9]